MTRTKNRPIWDAIERLVGHYLADERTDYEGCPEESRSDHVYPAWVRLESWATADREAAGRGYNGWSNYETWAVALWLDNEEHSHRYWQDAARECVRAAADHPHTREGVFPAASTARRLLADRLKEEVEADAPDLGANLYADLLGAALDEVEWSEVADGYLDGLDDESATDDAADPAPTLGVEGGITPEPPVMILAVDRAKFPLGRLVCTPGAGDAVPSAEMAAALDRHLAGDWGDVSPEDRAENDLSLREGARLLSAYRTEAGVTFWVVTEADRSVTTVLLPAEY